MDKNIPLSKLFFPGILPLVGLKQYERIMARYCEIYSKHAMPDNPVLQHHLVDGILPGLAYYQILREEGKTQESAIAKIDQVFKDMYLSYEKRYQKLGRLPFVYPILRAYIKTAMRDYPADGWDMEWQQVDGDAVRFKMKSCFYYNVLSAYGAPELTASFCQIDDNIYGEMSSQVLWQRTQTIGRGAEDCDFCFANAKKAVQ